MFHVRANVHMLGVGKPQQRIIARPNKQQNKKTLLFRRRVRPPHTHCRSAAFAASKFLGNPFILYFGRPRMPPTWSGGAGGRSPPPNKKSLNLPKQPWEYRHAKSAVSLVGKAWVASHAATACIAAASTCRVLATTYHCGLHAQRRARNR